MADWLIELRTKVLEHQPLADMVPLPNNQFGVYTRERDQGSPLPAVVLHVISEPVEPTMAGAQELTRARLQVDCLAEDIGTARALAFTFRDALPFAWKGATNAFDKVVADKPTTDGGQTETGYIHRARFDVAVWNRPKLPGE